MMMTMTMVMIASDTTISLLAYAKNCFRKRRGNGALKIAGTSTLEP